jgi:hypothetical protein
VDAQRGSPVRNAQINVHQPYPYAFLTGWSLADGRFEILGLAPGAHSLWALKNGYLSGARPFQPNAKFEVRAGVTTKIGDVPLRPAAQVAGTVTDPWGEPCEKTFLRLRGKNSDPSFSWLGDVETSTDDRGLFTAFGVEAGAYTLEMVSPGCVEPSFVRQSVTNSGKVHWIQEQPVAKYWGARTASKESPEFEAGYGGRRSGLSIRLTTAVREVPSPLVFPGTASLVLRFVDRITKKPVPHVRVTLLLEPPRPGLTRSLATVADETGGVSLSGFADGAYLATVSRRGYVLETMEVKTGPMTQIEVSPGATIAGRIVADGSPASSDLRERLDLLRRVLDEGQIRWTPFSYTTADQTGHYRISALPEGEFTIRTIRHELQTSAQRARWAPNRSRNVGTDRVFLGGTTDEARAVVIQANGGLETEAPAIEIRGLPIYRFSGRLLERTTGRPLANVNVRLGETRHPASSVGTVTFAGEFSSTGEFSFDGLRSGPYSLVVSRNAPSHEIHRIDIEVTGHDILGRKILVDPPVTLTGRVECKECEISGLVGTRIYLRRELEMDQIAVGSRETISYHQDPYFTIRADGVGSFGNVWPGLYRVGLGSGDYSVIDVRQDGQNLSTKGIVDIREVGELTIVVTEKGRAASRNN